MVHSFYLGVVAGHEGVGDQVSDRCGGAKYDSFRVDLLARLPPSVLVRKSLQTCVVGIEGSKRDNGSGELVVTVFYGLCVTACPGARWDSYWYQWWSER